MYIVGIKFIKLVAAAVDGFDRAAGSEDNVNQLIIGAIQCLQIGVAGHIYRRQLVVITIEC